MEKAFLIMEDWAQNLTFEPVEIDKERGVIVEEWRQRRGASARMQDRLFPILLKGSRYAERSPIGTKASIESFSHDRLETVLQGLVPPRSHGRRRGRRLRPGRGRGAGAETLRVDARAAPRRGRARPSRCRITPGRCSPLPTDKEVTGASVGVYTKLPVREQATVLSYRQRTIDNLYAGMLNARLAEISQKADPPFMAAGVNRNIFVRSTETAVLSAVTAPGGIERALEALLTEAARVTQHGFTATELEREKRDLLRLYEQAVVEVAKQDSTPLAEEYIRSFLLGESIPGIRWEYEQHQRFLPGVTLAEVNALAREWHSAENRVVVVSAPDQPGLTIPTEARLAAVMASCPGRLCCPTLIPRAPRNCWTRSRSRSDCAGDGHSRDRRDGVGIVQRREGPAQADHLQAGRGGLSGDQPGWIVAGVRPRLRGRDDGEPGGCGGRRGQLRPGRPAQGADGQGRQRRADDWRDVRGPGRRRIGQGHRDDLPADLPVRHAAEG